MSLPKKHEDTCLLKNLYTSVHRSIFKISQLDIFKSPSVSVYINNCDMPNSKIQRTKYSVICKMTQAVSSFKVFLLPSGLPLACLKWTYIVTDQGFPDSSVSLLFPVISKEQSHSIRSLLHLVSFSLRF